MRSRSSPSMKENSASNFEHSKTKIKLLKSKIMKDRYQKQTKSLGSNVESIGMTVARVCCRNTRDVGQR